MLFVCAVPALDNDQKLIRERVFMDEPDEREKPGVDGTWFTELFDDNLCKWTSAQGCTLFSECNSLDQFPDSCISQLSILNVCLRMNSWDKNTSISLQHYANYSVVKHHNINPYLMNSCRSNHLKSRYSSSLIFTYKTQIVFGIFYFRKWALTIQQPSISRKNVDWDVWFELKVLLLILAELSCIWQSCL